MRRWGKTKGLAPAAYQSWRSSLPEGQARQPRILAWAMSADGGLVVLGPAALSTQRDGSWRHTGWHEIERGGWNAETGQLRWQTYDGGRGAVALADPAKVPAVFQERVAASIVFERFVPVAEGSDRGVIVSGRRDLAEAPAQGPVEIRWHATLTRGVTWRTAGVRDLADAALEQLRDEYDDR